MPPVARIIDQSHEKKDHWVYIARSGVSSVYGVILDGSGFADSDGKVLDPTILGPRFSCRSYQLDLRTSSFSNYPVKVYGVPTPSNPGGEFEIRSLTGDVVFGTNGVSNSGSAPTSTSIPKTNDSGAYVNVGGISVGVSSATLSAPKVIDPPVKKAPKVWPKAPVNPKVNHVRAGADGIPIITVDQIPVFLDALRIEQSVMIWGKPGVGKSAGVQQFSSERNLKIYELRLNQIDPTAIQGIGVADLIKNKCVWLPAEFIPDQPNSLLFLDELTSAPQTIQTLAYQITLDRAIGSRRLPEDCRVICAGNRITDRGVAYTPPSALANRLLHVMIEPDIAAWRKWAFPAGIDPRIISFLSVKPDLLHVLDAVRCGGPWPSPRSWTSVSPILNSKLSPENMGIGIAACVGAPEAKEFVKFCTDFPRYLKKVYDILDGVDKSKLTDPSSATTIAIAVAANATSDEDILKNAMVWGNKQNEEFRSILVHGLEGRFGEEVLMNITEYADFAKGSDDLNF